MTFDTTELKKYAEEFEQIVSKYAVQDEDAAALYKAMSKYIMDAKEERILAPIRMPNIGRSYFDEGELRKYADLNEAFAKFNLKLKGFDIPED